MSPVIVDFVLGLKKKIFLFVYLAALSLGFAATVVKIKVQLFPARGSSTILAFGIFILF